MSKKPDPKDGKRWYGERPTPKVRPPGEKGEKPQPKIKPPEKK